ncbi:glycosyltransferase family 9 protein [Selenomonas caprae]|uniref:Glycosyltransferase family 9 protein n=2 Tax=Selenomonas caprae TaxID=2606905 RepID=A0A5D6WPF2_9FIRM|nr:glycosyltransferase family 9 protein [Selenomonas caprae]
MVYSAINEKGISKSMKTERNNPLLKRLDKWIGIPALYLLGKFHHPQARPQTYRRIALIKTAAVGDTIILSAMVEEVKRAYPDADITVICSKNNAAMVKCLPHVNRVETFVMKRPWQSLRRIGALGHYDLVLDFGPWPRINGVISWWLDADYKVGFYRPDTHRHYIYDAKVEHSDCLHEIENYRNLLRGAGIAPMGLLPDLRTDKRLLSSSYAVLHLFPGGAMDRQRRWTDAGWQELAKQLHQQYGVQILLSGGPADTEEAQEVCDRLQCGGIPAENIAGKYSLKDMASILQYAKLVVSVNTGIMHYAAAVGVPLVAIHGATSEVRWGPLSEKARVVKSGLSCQPCISLGFESECTAPVCMEKVTVPMVMEKIEKVLEA